MHYYKRIISSIMTTAALSTHAYAACAPTTLIATAYYSPLPDQETYVMGDFESEKILQGEGTHGASGRAVFDGMIAASPNYTFGTQIVIDGRGIGQVEDRGWAIVQAGERGYEYDRIDIWMGYGDEGRIAALTRGKRTIHTQVCDANTYSLYELGVGSIHSSLKHGSTWTAVSRVQQYLINEGYLARAKPTGYFGDETAAALCDRQVNQWITTANSNVCGLYGPATRAVMRNTNTLVAQSSVITQTNNITTEPKTNDQKLTTTTSSNLYALGESGFHIIELQQQLFDEWYYESDITGYYDQATADALTEKQKIIAIAQEQLVKG